MYSHRPISLPFVQAIEANPTSKVFRVLHPHADDPGEWRLEPLDVAVLSDDERGDGFFIVAALNVLQSGRMRHCYMDISLPERINDFAYFVAGANLRRNYTHEFEGEIIPAIAIDCSGVYELFYSKSSPEVGIEVLKSGLAASIRKHCIAEDLGYIYRDESRYCEAAKMFRLAADEGPSSYFIYGELAQAYEKIGETAEMKRYMELFRSAERGRG